MRRQVSGKKIRVAMAEIGIRSITELSNRSGVSRPKLYKLLNGESPYQTSLLHIAETLKIDPEDLTDGETCNEHD
ncbi:helix-turn-helix domain-containing protein [Corynebacterium sp. H130]|uniref:helix-turn-helix domain-containing protein n=1 Tax=Corynebacterium sp. H130 TaxID=3133444 RepID=UPI00403FC204